MMTAGGPLNQDLIARWLPTDWTVEIHSTYGTILCAVGKRGFVTVDERRRSFALGISAVRHRGNYYGRNWRIRLYRDAVAALTCALVS